MAEIEHKERIVVGDLAAAACLARVSKSLRILDGLNAHCSVEAVTTPCREEADERTTHVDRILEVDVLEQDHTLVVVDIRPL